MWVVSQVADIPNTRRKSRILPAMELNMPTTSAMVVVNIVLRVYVYYAEDT